MKRSYFVNLFLTAMAAISLSTFTGCQEAEEDTSAPSLSLSEKNFTISTEGGSATVEITANRDWKATSESTLVVISPAEGTGNATMTITVPATTESYVKTTVDVSISNNYGPIQTETISIIQGEIPNNGAPYKFEFNAIKSTQDTATADEIAYAEDGVEFVYSNMHYSEQYGNVTIEGNGYFYNTSELKGDCATLVINYQNGEAKYQNGVVYAGTEKNPATEITEKVSDDKTVTYTLPANTTYVKVLSVGGYIRIYSVEIRTADGGVVEPDGPDEPSAGIEGDYVFDHATLGGSWVNDTEKELNSVNWYIDGMKGTSDISNIGFSYHNEVGGSCYNKTAFGTGVTSVVILHKKGEPVTVYAGSNENPTGEAITPTVDGLVYTYTITGSCPYITLKNNSTDYINVDGIAVNFDGELGGGNGGGTDEPDVPTETKDVDIAGFKADANADTFYKLGEVTVTYCIDGNLFVKDASGYLWIYGNSIKADAYKAGDVMIGITGKYSIFNGLIELVEPTLPAVESTPGDATVLELTPAEVTEDHIGAYVLLKGVKINTADSKLNDVLKFYNKFELDLPAHESTADVYAIVATYNNLQVYPVSFENVKEPVLAAGVTVCDFDNILTAMGKVEADVDADNGLEVKDAQFDNFTITSDKGSSSYSFRLWANGKTIRSYAGNTVTITAKNGKKVTSVVFSNSEVTAATVGSFDAKTWTGSADAVTLTVGKATNTSVSVAVE